MREKMEAGREMDIACAEAAGYVVWYYHAYGQDAYWYRTPKMQRQLPEIKKMYGDLAPHYVEEIPEGALVRDDDVPKFSTNIFHAFSLFKELAGSPGYEVLDLRYCSAGWAVREPFGNIMTVVATGDTAPVAICRAYLKAKKVSLREQN